MDLIQLDINVNRHLDLPFTNNTIILYASTSINSYAISTYVLDNERNSLYRNKKKLIAFTPKGVLSGDQTARLA